MKDTGQTILELDNWRIIRKGTLDIGPLSFHLRDGEITTVMGPSGIGKTTLLLSILGFNDQGVVQSGTRHFMGSTLKRFQVPTKSVYIPQSFPFNPNWEVASYLLKLPWGRFSSTGSIRMTSRQRQARVHEVLTKLGISDRATAVLAELSGGEAQRAALAQMILLQPRLVVGDEFVSALDPGLVASVLDEFVSTIRLSKGTAILALHNVEAAVSTSDHILVIMPRSISEKPVHFKRMKRNWCFSIVHTLLCLSRWSLEKPFDNGIVRLAKLLVKWICDTDYADQYISKLKPHDTYELDLTGELIACSVKIPDLRTKSISYSDGSWLNLRPALFDTDGKSYVSITFRHRNSRNASIIAQAN